MLKLAQVCLRANQQEPNHEFYNRFNDILPVLKGSILIPKSNMAKLNEFLLQQTQSAASDQQRFIAHCLCLKLLSCIVSYEGDTSPEAIEAFIGRLLAQYVTRQGMLLGFLSALRNHWQIVKDADVDLLSVTSIIVISKLEQTENDASEVRDIAIEFLKLVLLTYVTAKHKLDPKRFGGILDLLILFNMQSKVPEGVQVSGQILKIICTQTDVMVLRNAILEMSPEFREHLKPFLPQVTEPQPGATGNESGSGAGSGASQGGSIKLKQFGKKNL
jgi:hypothetical protein